jgi:phage tail sheath protein FI
MPEYLAPGVYPEETSFRNKSIEGVGTTITGFVGPTRYGPTEGEPEVLTSLIEFERTYGDRQQLAFSDVADPMHNFIWHAVRGFFDQGGSKLYHQRIFRPRGPGDDGRAHARVPEVSPLDPTAILIEARFPGAAGNRAIRLTLSVGPNVLSGQPGSPRVTTLLDRDVVWVSDIPTTSPPASPPARTGRYALARLDTTTGQSRWTFAPIDPNPANELIQLDALTPDPDPSRTDEIRVITLTVTAYPAEEEGISQVWAGLPLDPQHRRLSSPDSVFALFDRHPENQALARTLPLIIVAGHDLEDGIDVLGALFRHAPSLPTTLVDLAASENDRSIDLALADGNDGARPKADDYTGDDVPGTTLTTGLLALTGIEGISIMAAPGSTFGYEGDYRDQAATIMGALIGHAEHMRYRIAVLDAGDAQTIGQVQDMRGRFDSKYAAFYYPWVRVLDPVTQREIDLPPSGFVAGIYARNDVERAVYKAPANEVVTGAIGFEFLLNKAQQEVLNPQGVNCFRFFEGRGYRLWGARTISSDPEWKYVNLRRYFIYLEHSIDRGTQWAVFEPNGERLWANVRGTIEAFLFNEWNGGALLGDKPEKAFFVKCDRSTMTQNDLDNGRLVCLVGVAPLRPAEFVIFRIGQWTADAK